MIHLTNNRSDPNGYWDRPITKMLFKPTAEDVALFDQNGYDLTVIEQHFAYGNLKTPKSHREHIRALKQDWFTQDYTTSGPVLNHSLLFERKGYIGPALAELTHWAKELPLMHKIISMRPKWGLDFSMDYVDHDGNAFEVLHWEWDSFDYLEIEAVRKEIEPVLLNINWLQAAQDLLKYKSQWHHLDFFAQSDWKCEFFGIPKERFKMVIWR
jgi:hypothetical protein